MGDFLFQAPWRNHHDATICRQASNAIRAADTEALNWRQARRVGETQSPVKPKKRRSKKEKWVKMMQMLEDFSGENSAVIFLYRTPCC